MYANIFLASSLLHACLIYSKFEDHPLEKPGIEEDQYEVKPPIKCNRIPEIFWFLGFHPGKTGRTYNQLKCVHFVPFIMFLISL